MQGCKYNVKEFNQFVSGRKKIVPAVTDDWEVFTGGFKSSIDVLNLKSDKLNQKIYDISTHSFFKFMRNENVTMNGNKIVGRFVIGQQRVLRKESDYDATMATVKERKSTIIEKKDLIVGHKYETVCGSQFVFAGVKYIKKLKENSKKFVFEFTKVKKTYLKYGSNRYWGDNSNITDIGNQKIVRDLGVSNSITTNQLAAKIKEWVSFQRNNVVYCSDTPGQVEIELSFEEASSSGSGYLECGGVIYKDRNRLFKTSTGEWVLGGLIPNKFLLSIHNRWFSSIDYSRPDVKHLKPIWGVKNES